MGVHRSGEKQQREAEAVALGRRNGHKVGCSNQANDWRRGLCIKHCRKMFGERFTWS